MSMILNLPLLKSMHEWQIEDCSFLCLFLEICLGFSTNGKRMNEEHNLIAQNSIKYNDMLGVYLQYNIRSDCSRDSNKNPR